MTSDDMVTVREFKMWLSGIESMNSDNWHPNKLQWKKIREKIELIADGIPTTFPAYHMPQQFAPVDQGYMATTSSSEFVNTASSILPTDGGVRSISSQGLFANPDAPSLAVKTPNIDTSTGEYKSAFA